MHARTDGRALRFSPMAPNERTDRSTTSPGVTTPRDLSSLSDREVEVTRLVCLGYSNKGIGYVLSVSTGAVCQYIRRIRSKLHLRTRCELITTLASTIELPPEHAIDNQLAAATFRLTRAECEVLAELLAGRTNAQIATCRKRSPRTIACQISGLMRKVGVGSRAELVGAFVRARLAWTVAGVSEVRGTE